MPQSPHRETALALVAAFNTMDINAIISHRSPDCLRHFLPASMVLAPQDNATYASSLHKLKAVFSNFVLTVNDLLEDTEGHRICMHLSATADTAAGKYTNEYIWWLEFDEPGTKIRQSKEFSDTSMARDFYPKLQAAMSKYHADKGSS